MISGVIVFCLLNPFSRCLIFGHIPVDTRFHIWGIPLPPKCHCCFEDPQFEPVFHLFLLSHVVESDWLHFASWFHFALPHNIHITHIFGFWRHIIPHADTVHVCFLVLYLIFWFTSVERNNHKHVEIPFFCFTYYMAGDSSLASVGAHGKLLPIQWRGCTLSVAFMPPGTLPVPRSARSTLVCWLLPPPLWIKFNIDGLFDRLTSVTFGAGLIHDLLSNLKLAFHTPLEVTSSFDAEL